MIQWRLVIGVQPITIVLCVSELGFQMKVVTWNCQGVGNNKMVWHARLLMALSLVRSTKNGHLTKTSSLTKMAPSEWFTFGNQPITSTNDSMEVDNRGSSHHNNLACK